MVFISTHFYIKGDWFVRFVFKFGICSYMICFLFLCITPCRLDNILICSFSIKWISHDQIGWVRSKKFLNRSKNSLPLSIRSIWTITCLEAILLLSSSGGPQESLLVYKQESGPLGWPVHQHRLFFLSRLSPLPASNSSWMLIYDDGV